MKRKIELLAPGGDIESIKAAIAAGADAVYCGLNKFSARDRAKNIDIEDLNGILNLAHKNNCRIFITINIIIVGSELPYLVKLLNKLVNMGIDGVIVQDLGLFYLLSKYFKSIEVHASTQLNTHNKGQIKFLSRLSAARVNLSRELNLDEIKDLTLAGQKNNMETEVFVHGSYCLSFSGICYMSSVLGGTSGNRGRCSQPCRDRYMTTPEGKNFPLNLKDNSAYFDLKELSDTNVASLKIEGRIKKSDYVYAVVNCWKKQLQGFYENGRLNSDNKELYTVFNRDFSNSFLTGDINKNMFIDNPRDHSIKQLSEINNFSTVEQMEKNREKFYEDKAVTTALIKKKIEKLSTAKSPLTLEICGELDTPLKVSVKTPDESFIVFSEMNLALEREKTSGKCLSHHAFLTRLKSINDTQYYINNIELGSLQKDLFLSSKELGLIKKKILFVLGSKKMDPIEVPFLKKQKKMEIRPRLSVLISSKRDLHLCSKTSADIFFQLPNCFAHGDSSRFIDLFLKNKTLIPLFPSVLIGKNYTAAVHFLENVQPKSIVTNNTGIAYEAFKMGIPWIAGPCLNIVNSFSLLCLKETFNCHGAFISNEISKNQIKRILPPENFKLYYSMYHPISLLTTRQCLFHQITGCEKDRVDEECIQKCNKSSSITNLKKISLFIKKSKRNYHSIYNDNNFLNTDIARDLHIFTSLSIDLRDIKTETAINTDKQELIKLFENLLNGDPDAKEELEQIIHPSTNTQYLKGI